VKLCLRIPLAQRQLDRAQGDLAGCEQDENASRRQRQLDLSAAECNQPKAISAVQRLHANEAVVAQMSHR
jgi:hypothetical protein